MLHRTVVYSNASIPNTIILSAHGLSANPREMLVWKQIVLSGDALTIFTKNRGNPLCLCNVAIGSRLSVLKPLKTDSFRGAPGVDGEEAPSTERTNHAGPMYRARHSRAPSPCGWV